MKFELDKRFTKQAKGVFEKYVFDVGILTNKQHYKAQSANKYGLKSYAAGPARKVGPIPSGMSIAEVSQDLRKKTGINFFTAPFKSKKNRDILNFSKSFFDLCAGRGQKRQVENYLQAIVRNPILRGDYGSNSKVTAKIKGFNRFMIDTAQVFRNITATTRKNPNVSR